MYTSSERPKLLLASVCIVAVDPASSGPERTFVARQNMATPISVSTLYGHTSFVHSIAFNFDGSKIVSGSFDNNVKVWDVRESSCVTRP